MYAHQLGLLATQHITDQHEAAAARYRTGGAAGARPANPVRRRAGWALVHLGLRLALGPADA